MGLRNELGVKYEEEGLRQPVKRRQMLFLHSPLRVDYYRPFFNDRILGVDRLQGNSVQHIKKIGLEHFFLVENCLLLDKSTGTKQNSL